MLGIILGIGIPKYSMMQAQAEWEADVVTLKSIAKMAEIFYAQGELAGVEVDEDGYYKIEITHLHNAGLFDKETVPNRVVGENYKSVRNTDKLSLEDCEVYIWIDGNTGEADFVDNNDDGVNDQYAYFIGLKPPYDVTYYGDMGLVPWEEF